MTEDILKLTRELAPLRVVPHKVTKSEFSGWSVSTWSEIVTDSAPHAHVAHCPDDERAYILAFAVNALADKNSAIAQAITDERARVVAWLRDRRNVSSTWGVEVDWLANAIERGEHTEVRS